MQLIEKAASSCNFNYFEKTTPFKWGEDFGLFTTHFKGAMFGIGAGEKTPELHNPDYDFPDDLIESASKLFIKIISYIQDE